MTRFTRILAAVVLAAPGAAPTLAAQSESVPRMADVMSPSELRETGIAAMTPAQRAALDGWLARYTAIIERAASRGAQSAGPSSSGNDESYAGPPSTVYGSRISAVRDGGTSILLADGTVWEVYLPNRPSTTRWAVGDFVIVGARAVEQNGVYYFTLINGRDGSSAAVQWRGKE